METYFDKMNDAKEKEKKKYEGTSGFGMPLVVSEHVDDSVDLRISLSRLSLEIW